MHDKICGRLDALSSSNVTLTDAIEKMPFEELKEFLTESMKKMKESNIESAQSKEQSQKKKNQMKKGKVMGSAVGSAMFPWLNNKG